MAYKTRLLAQLCRPVLQRRNKLKLLCSVDFLGLVVLGHSFILKVR